MGLFSSGKSTSLSGSAQKWAKPFATAAAGNVQDVVSQNAPTLAQLTGTVTGMVPGLADKFQAGNPGVDAAGSYITDVLGGKYMGGNPHLQGMIDQTAGDVTSRVNANFGSRGSFGGTAHTTALGKALAGAENSLRYGNYSDEMNRMAGAAGMSPSIAQGEYAGLSELLQSAGVGAELPYTGINALSGNLASLFSGGKQTQKGPGFLSQALGAGAQAAGAYFGATSDVRAKQDIERLGETEDGLGWYEFAYKSEPGVRYRGVMAQEVAEKRPDALGPMTTDGFMTVHYGKLSRQMERA